MNTKTRGSEKMQFSCNKNGKRSFADFENVEEALQASGGLNFKFWWWEGTPDPFILTNPQMTKNAVLPVENAVSQAGHTSRTIGG